MGFISPQALVVPSLRLGYYSSAFRLINPIDTSETVSNYYVHLSARYKYYVFYLAFCTQAMVVDWFCG